MTNKKIFLPPEAENSREVPPAVRLIIKTCQKIPPLPSSILELLQKLASPEVSVKEISRIIERDQALSAMILKQINSAYYGLPRRVYSLKQAVALLGINEIRHLALRLSLRKTLLSEEALFLHALKVAALCEHRTEGGFDPSLAYTAGLLHDIGKLVLKIAFKERYQHLDSQHLWGRNLTEFEKDLFLVDHAQAGGLLADFWRLPPVLAEAIMNHHRSPEGLAGLVGLADEAVNTEELSVEEKDLLSRLSL
ncbi:HDOD domain-containing protein [Thermosulfuriphilus sp.]